MLRASAAIFHKDLLIEWRSRARSNALVFFAMATLLLFSFAVGPDIKVLQRNASAYLWLALLFAAVLALGESFRVEAENAALEGLRLLPVDPRAVFLGKAIGNAALLFLLGLLLLPVTVGVLGASVKMGFGAYAGVLALGCLAISAPGTIHSAIANHARARDVLLPLLLFPLLVPALLATTKATALVLEGDPMGQFSSWLWLLAGFNFVYWGLGLALFPSVVEE
jgi:heme exporter protein B